MGWLRHAMDARDPRVTSFDDLARACLAHGDWPAGVQPKPRSLGALFSKFDRGIEVEWLEDRAQAQVALAKVLLCPLPVLQAELKRHVQVVDVQAQRYRLPEAPFARLLDLTTLALPPSVPSLLARPNEWRAHWWTSAAGDGDGVELVRRWLAARGLARVAVVANWAEAALQLELPGPLFLELGPEFPRSQPLPQRGGLCIRALWPPTPGFTEPPSTPLAENLPPLLAWLGEFLGADGRFSASQALPWIQTAHAAGLVDCFDAVVGLGALLDEFGYENVRGRSFAELAQQWLERRFTEAAAQQPADSPWPPARTLELITGMAHTALVAANEEWSAARSLDGWSSLVPTEIQRELDTRAAQATLSRAPTKVTVDQLTGTLRRTRDHVNGALRGLLAIHCLDSVVADRFRLAPRWIANVAQTTALNNLVSGDVSAWGEALLERPHRSKVRRLLLGQLRSGERRFLDRVLERDDDNSPAAVLGAETLGELVGEALLYGAEFDDEPLKGLFALQLSSLATSPVGDEVSPRLLCSPADELAYTSWQLAWWVIAEQVSPEPLPCPASLDPWGAESIPASRTLDRVLALLQSRGFDSYVTNTYALLGRLFQNEQAANRGHLALLPTQLQPDSTWDTWSRLTDAPHGLQALHALSVEREPSWPQLAAGAWTAWLTSNFDPRGEPLFAPAAPSGALLWPHIPPRVLLGLVSSGHALSDAIPWALLNREHHGALLNGDWAQFPAALCPLFEVIDEELVPLAARLVDAGSAAAPWHRLWQRFPVRTLGVAVAELRAGHYPAAVRLLVAAPPDQRALVAETAVALVSVPELAPARPWVAQCLHRYIVDRAPGWRDAYVAFLTLQSLPTAGLELPES